MATSRRLRLIEIAELLGVTKQRAHQIADEPGFPAPIELDGRGRLALGASVFVTLVGRVRLVRIGEQAAIDPVRPDLQA